MTRSPRHSDPAAAIPPSTTLRRIPKQPLAKPQRSPRILRKFKIESDPEWLVVSEAGFARAFAEEPIAQALTEDMEVVTADPLFDAYPVSVLW